MKHFLRNGVKHGAIDLETLKLTHIPDLKSLCVHFKIDRLNLTALSSVMELVHYQGLLEINSWKRGSIFKIVMDCKY